MNPLSLVRTDSPSQQVSPVQFEIELNLLECYPNRDIFYANIGTHINYRKDHDNEGIIIQHIIGRRFIFAVTPGHRYWNLIKKILKIDMNSILIVKECPITIRKKTSLKNIHNLLHMTSSLIQPTESYSKFFFKTVLPWTRSNPTWWTKV
jgi:hypothetical protein